MNRLSKKSFNVGNAVSDKRSTSRRTSRHTLDLPIDVVTTSSIMQLVSLKR